MPFESLLKLCVAWTPLKANATRASLLTSMPVKFQPVSFGAFMFVQHERPPGSAVFQPACGQDGRVPGGA